MKSVSRRGVYFSAPLSLPSNLLNHNLSRGGRGERRIPQPDRPTAPFTTHRFTAMFSVRCRGSTCYPHPDAPNPSDSVPAAASPPSSLSYSCTSFFLDPSTCCLTYRVYLSVILRISRNGLLGRIISLTILDSWYSGGIRVEYLAFKRSNLTNVQLLPFFSFLFFSLPFPFFLLFPSLGHFHVRISRRS